MPRRRGSLFGERALRFRGALLGRGLRFGRGSLRIRKLRRCPFHLAPRGLGLPGCGHTLFGERALGLRRALLRRDARQVRRALRLGGQLDRGSTLGLDPLALGALGLRALRLDALTLRALRCRAFRLDAVALGALGHLTLGGGCPLGHLTLGGSCALRSRGTLRLGSGRSGGGHLLLLDEPDALDVRHRFVCRLRLGDLFLFDQAGRRSLFLFDQAGRRGLFLFDETRRGLDAHLPGRRARGLGVPDVLDDLLKESLERLTRDGAQLAGDVVG